MGVTRRYAGVRADGYIQLAPVLCTAATLAVTWDATGRNASLRIGLAKPDVSALALGQSAAFRASVTDATVRFAGGRDFGALIGRNVTLAVEMDGGTLYTAGFG